jgi:aryl-alcohol dehydrogenase-like predicted oxidoreductase
MRLSEPVSTLPSLSRVGMGGWQAGGTGPWGGGPRSDDALSIAAIRRAIEGGVTWVETAASYGLGHSEVVIRAALEPWAIGRDVLVFTKCGHPWELPDRIWTELTPASIRRECDASLRRLGVERIDLYHFHHPDPNVPVEDSWGTMADLVAEGKVRWAGLSNHPVELLDRCERLRHVDSIQPELNLLRRDALADVVPWARSHGSAVLAYSPQAGGALATAIDAGRLASLDPSKVGIIRADSLVGLRASLGQLATSRGISLGALAVAWVLRMPGVTGAICGARTPTHVEGWLPAADVNLDGMALASIDAALAVAESAGVE